MQGFNQGRYIPPDEVGKRSGNQIHHRRAPGTLRKDGTQTVRFEMPYAVICGTCKPEQIIGQGTRFNAVKKKVGNYLSTAIWSFTFKHQACGAGIEIRTDPKTTAYVVIAGGKARDYGGDKVREGEGGVPILTAEERERRREDAFAQLEDRVEDAKAVKESRKRVEELYEARERDWDDPWSANRRLRAGFRRERKVLKREEMATEALKERLGTGMEILPERREDGETARLVLFGAGDEETGEGMGANAAGKGLFEKGPPIRAAQMRRKGTKEECLEALRRRVVGNTRAAMNPFGSSFGQK